MTSPHDDGRLARAAEAASRVIPAFEGGDAPVRGYRVSVRDVAVHIAASIAGSGHAALEEGVAAVAPMAIAIARRIGESDERAVAERVGRHGVHYAHGVLGVAGRHSMLSAALPGFHDVGSLPPTLPDDDALTVRFGALLGPDARPWARVESRIEGVDAVTAFIVDHPEVGVPIVQEAKALAHRPLRSPSELNHHARTAMRILGHRAAIRPAARDLATRVAAAFEGTDAAVGDARVTGIDMPQSGDRITLEIPVAMLSHALSPTVESIWGVLDVPEDGAASLEVRSLDVASRHRQRARRVGTGLAISVVGRRLVVGEGFDLAAIVRDVATEVGARHRWTTPDGRALVARLSDGRITFSLALRTGARWEHDRVTLPDALPAVIMAALAGRPMEQVTTDAAFAGATVAAARRRKDGRSVIRLAPWWEPCGDATSAG